MNSTKAMHPTGGYLRNLPGGLRRAFASGRWLPIIGAGISASATTSDRRSPPNWHGLRDRLAEDLASTASTNPIDVISAYADTYGRASLIERLSELLLIDDIEPGDVHRAFTQLPFDMVVTTNIDFLLERAYDEQRRPCNPLIGESQLSLQRRAEATNLLKFHGDLRHPDDLVMTEDDYDGFIRRNPILATYLSWWLPTREPVFIGYSLDDADLRELLALLRERLGRMTRPAWALLPTDPHNEARKFERRGIRPIVLNPDPAADRAQVWTAFFQELRTEWENSVATQIEAGTDATTAELIRSRIAPQLALFVASDSTLALYREYLFPSVPGTGFLAAGIDEIRTLDRATKPMALDMALSKAAVVIYDAGRRTPIAWEYVVGRRNGNPVVIEGSDDVRPLFGAGIPQITRPETMDPDAWQAALVGPLAVQLEQLKTTMMQDPVIASQLTDLKEQVGVKGSENRTFTASKQLLMACLALLESQLRNESGLPTALPATAIPSGGQMTRLRDYFGSDFDAVIQAVQLRHTLLQSLDVSATDLVKSALDVYSVVQRRLPTFS